MSSIRMAMIPKIACVSITVSFVVWPTSQCDILGGSKGIRWDDVLNALLGEKHVYLKNPALECFWMIEEDLRGLIWTNCSNAMFGKSLERFNRRNCSWEIAVDMGLLPNLRLFFAGNSSQLLMQLVSHMQVKPNPFHQAISSPPFIQLPAMAWELLVNFKKFESGSDLPPWPQFHAPINHRHVYINAIYSIPHSPIPTGMNR